MPKVKIARLGATHNRKPLGAVGDVVDVDASRFVALVSLGYATPVEDDSAEPETAPVEPAETEVPAEPDADENATEDTPNPAAEADKGEDAPEDDDDAPAEPHKATAKEIREWAKAQGLDVPARGAISDDVREKYDAAHAAK